MACMTGSVDCEVRAAHCEHRSKPCTVGHVRCEIGSRNCELKYFSCEMIQGRGERSSFPGEQGAAVCGLLDISWEMDSVSCEGEFAGCFKTYRRRSGHLVSVSP